MKPNFALNLTHENIGLLHRTARGWLEIGSAALDDPDMGEALNYLRRSALGLAPHGVATKLVIPGSQILYFETAAPGPDDARRRDQIRKALEGRTPYAVDDLVFDWSGAGPNVQVAVVARETLTEAEQFAAQYKFNPVAFVAIPQNGEFVGEPWFGPTKMATESLSDGEEVERDSEAVTIVSREVPRQEPKPVEPPQTTRAEPKGAAKPMAEDVSGAGGSAPKVKTEFEAGPPVAVAPPKTAPVAVKPTDKAKAAETTPDKGAASGPEAPFEDVADTETETGGPAPLSERQDTASALVTASEIPVEEPPVAAPAFSSRRTANGAIPTLGPASGRGASSPATATGDAAKMPAARFSPMGVSPAVSNEFSAKAAVVKAAGPMVSALKAGVAKRKPDPAKVKGLGGLVTDPGIPGLPKRKSKPAPAVSPVLAEAPAKQEFGGPAIPRRGKPKYLGLILTAALLLFLALIAAWSSFYLASRNSAPSDTDVASGVDAGAPLAETPGLATEAMDTPTAIDATTDQLVDVAPADMPSMDDEAMADMQDPTPAPDTGETAMAATTAPQTATPEGSSQLAPPADTQDEIFLATMDEPPVESDASSLPKPQTGPDALPAAQLPPPPFGTLYEFDADGLIKPTADGIITPDGVRLVAGQPPVVPPARPAGLVPTVENPELAEPAADPAAATAAATLATQTPVYADPALAGFKPKPRPEGLVVLQAAPDDEASLAPAEDSRFASLRPRLRPKSVTAMAEAARQAAEAASLASATAAAAASDPVANAAPISRLAVAVSRRPAVRPKDFSRAVEAAVAAAVRAAEPDVQVAAVVAQPQQKAAPEADDEPEVVTAAPKIPTKASVAKNATYVNAINLSKINLIGVYGTSSKRYALVRLATGQYKKVKVGDRVDGGTVAAITDREVRYQKGGRMVALAMPKG